MEIIFLAFVFNVKFRVFVFMSWHGRSSTLYRVEKVDLKPEVDSVCRIFLSPFGRLVRDRRDTRTHLHVGLGRSFLRGPSFPSLTSTEIR